MQISVPDPDNLQILYHNRKSFWHFGFTGDIPGISFFLLCNLPDSQASRCLNTRLRLLNKHVN